MTKDQAKQWLLERKDILRISLIGKRAGIPNLSKWVNDATDGHGSKFTLADKHLPALKRAIDWLIQTP